MHFSSASEHIHFENILEREYEPILTVQNKASKEPNEIISIESKLKKIEKSYRRQNVLLYCICVSTTVNSIVIITLFQY